MVNAASELYGFPATAASICPLLLNVSQSESDAAVKKPSESPSTTYTDCGLGLEFGIVNDVCALISARTLLNWSVSTQYPPPTEPRPAGHQSFIGLALPESEFG